MVKTATNATNHGQLMIPQAGALRMQPAGACPCKEPATATHTVSHAARNPLELVAMVAANAIGAGLLMIPHNGTLLKACADASLSLRLKILSMVVLAQTLTTGYAALTAMTAVRPG